MVNISSNIRSTEGKIDRALLWLMVVPIPVLLIFLFMRGRT